MADDVAREDKARVAANVVKLGKTGLAALGTKLKSAVKKNARPVPGNILPQFAVPDLSGINWISTVYARSNGIARELSPARNAVQEHVDRDGPGLPLFVEFARECFHKFTSIPFSSRDCLQRSGPPSSPSRLL